MDQYRTQSDTSAKIMEQASELGQQAMNQATDAAIVARDTVKDYPMATLVAVGGIAFAIGALWKMQRSSQTSRWEPLMDRLAGLQEQLPRKWRV